ncbi:MULTISPECIES: hypothetical protein [unclassified Coleofasciculus]|uniref:hypothetical protein n=1 Tax=unclassified Coleofasciculus TaxID=2692782 RepID=UPI001882F551|nr:MULTISPECIES: hypothetical protein [unclassified Coleofasciculus]MBE9128559.1 hypothetical protein [Coleofasciculus sp. LEGE 07081]MBE9149361.1 hypothetical protein [Coleofasciculus sp. LEGE 07092]
MWITRLHQFLTAPTPHKSSPRTLFWLTLSLIFAALYGILALQQAFSSNYIVQDDARQHVFWMRRFLDESLFPKDLIADYFQSVAPLGYRALYQLMATLGIEPVVFSKILPLFLGLVMTGYCFAVSMELLPVPLTGFISSLLLNQNLWMQDGLVSGTPKAFIYPILLAFLYYLLRQSLVGVGIAIALLGLFYPSLVLVCAALLILQLWQFNRKLPYLTQNRRDYIFCLTSLTVAFLVLLPYTLSISEFSPVITAAIAKTLPDFLPQGRTSFFVEDAWEFWFNGRSGIRIDTALAPPLAYSGLLLPILLNLPSRFPLTQQITRGIGVLPKLLLASGILFFAAHALLFKLHLPSRYTQHSLRIAIALAAGITLTLLIDAISLGAKSTQLRQILALGSTALISITLLGYPHLALNTFPWTYYTVGGVPKLYEFFQQQPQHTLIASLAEEANNLPTFAQRSILVGREYAVPYHWGYYRQFRQRTLDLINAQYSPNPRVVRDFIEKYGIDFWLLPATPFTPDSIANNNWLMQYQPAANEAIAQLEAGKIPALKPLVVPCSVLETQDLVVLKADCILNSHSALQFVTQKKHTENDR